MKKTAIVIDFDSKLNLGSDVYMIDRYHDKVTQVVTSVDNEFSTAFLEEMTIEAFYRIISPHYKAIFCLFISYQYSDIEDHLLTQRINQSRGHNEAKMFTYLLNYKNPNKQIILNHTFEMISKGYEIKDVMIRIHQIRQKETFSLNQMMIKYLLCIL